MTFQFARRRKHSDPPNNPFKTEWILKGEEYVPNIQTYYFSATKRCLYEIVDVMSSQIMIKEIARLNENALWFSPGRLSRLDIHEIHRLTCWETGEVVTKEYLEKL